MKTVHTVDMVAHLWANQSQETARTSKGSYYFNGPVLYSYRDSAPIACFHGADTVLVTSHEYSVTTAHHKTLARRALHSVQTFTVPNVKPDRNGEMNHNDNLIHYAKDIEKSAVNALKCRKADTKRWSAECVLSLVNEANQYAEHFNLTMRFTAPNEDKLRQSIANAAKLKKEEERKTTERNKAAIAAAQTDVKRWVAGEDIYFPYVVNKVYLRIKVRENGTRILETSKRAEAPLGAALKLLPAIRAGVDQYGLALEVGGFRVKAIDAAGNLTVGCHYIERDEIERIAALAGA